MAGPSPSDERPEENLRIARLLHELGVLTARTGEPSARFRGRAYRRAAEALTRLDRPVTDLDADALTAVPGIGPGTAARITEAARTGTLRVLGELRAQDPGGTGDLRRVPGIGPVLAVRLREELGVRTVADLRDALAAGTVTGVRGLGPMSVTRLRSALTTVSGDVEAPPLPIAEAVDVIDRVTGAVRAATGVAAVTWTGSLARFADLHRELGLVAVDHDPAASAQALRRLPVVREATVEPGPPHRVRLVTFEGPEVTVWVTDPADAGATRVVTTGPRPHVAALARRAADRGLTLDATGLRDAAGGRVPTPDETAVYAALGLPPVPAEQRGWPDVLDRAAAGALPVCAEVADLRGDLHDHTDASGDGRMTLGELVTAAHERGWCYLGITDHAEDLRVNGMDRAAMLAQRREIAALRTTDDDLAILHGAELNIDPDGGVDYDPAFLTGYGWAVASVHSAFDLDPGAQTRRLVTAIRNPAVRAIGHLSGRRIGRRAGIRFDPAPVLAACRETGTALEVNCHLDRLDATAPVLAAAADAGVTVVISTDAHRVAELDNHRWGVRLARRGGVPRELVANTWPRDRFLAWAARP